MTSGRWTAGILGLAAGLWSAARSARGEEPAAPRRPYTVVDTGQVRCYDNTSEIADPAEGAAFRGQDAQYEGPQPNYRDNGDGTVTDLVTGLMWEKAVDLGRKQTFAEAKAGAARCRAGGRSDWRLPTIKELYSLILFSGSDPSGPDPDAPGVKPFLDTRSFDFVYGDPAQGERTIDAQYWSATEYVGRTMRDSPTVFGVNFADGRIKGYPRDTGAGGKPARQFVRHVRGNPAYGRNDFHDHGDGTVADRATGLVWQKADGGKAMSWERALACAEALLLGGRDDWRLPDAKELQSIVDYTRAPDAIDPAARGPALDPVFQVADPESYYWTGTTHRQDAPGREGGSAVYVCFGRAMGWMKFPGASEKQRLNVHGAGAQRSDPKTGDPAQFPQGRGPQGDDIRIFNRVRCVRGGDVKLRAAGPPAAAPAKAEPRGAGKPAAGEGGAPPGKRFVTRLDRDGDGRVSRQEFDGPPSHFDRLDRNRDGHLTEDEAPPGPPPGRR